MKAVAIHESEAFPLSTDELLSFADAPKPYRISGPPGLVRLVQRGRRLDGAFWFEEPVFRQLREHAKRDLARQTASSRQPFARPMSEMVGMYMKHCLRGDLAISKDWTEHFDSYVVLPLRPIDSMVAWVGTIRSQPYYSKPHPNASDYAAKKQAHDLAESKGIRLAGSEKQYIIRFDFPPNHTLKTRILGPWEF